MISSIYTFRNKQKVWVKLSSYVFVKSKKQFENLMDNLMDIDAVSYPEKDFNFPCVIKIENNTFAPRLSLAKKLEKEKSKTVKEVIDEIKSSKIEPVRVDFDY